jgi:acyl-CoA synthetase (AMP-forming)/AMP-acid ligase II
VLVLNEGMTVTSETIATHIEGKLARYKHPASFVIWPELPKSGYGKVVKRDVKRMLEAS